MKRFFSLLMLAGGLLCLLPASRAMAQTDAVLSCGYNADGEIGDNTTTNRLLLTPAHAISGIKAIACGPFHTLALDSSGIVWAWGNNSYGQLGTGDTTNRTTPVPIFYGAKAIAAGSFHSLALDADGSVWAWGYNAQGQLGLGDTSNRNRPTQVSSVSRIQAIACGGYHSLMVDDTTHLYACGWNQYGQLGTRDNADRLVPTLTLANQTGVMAVSAGFAHTEILWTYYTVWAAGFNGDGELGDGTTTDKNYFVPCGSASSGYVAARSIGAGLFHCLAVGPDGSVIAWGKNDHGQLGTGDTTNRLYPTTMPGATFAKAVAGGGYHSLVLTAGGQVLATGDNADGQLGNGTKTTRSTLAPVKNASLIGSIAAGQYHSVLLKPFTQSLATGDNNYGQLGIGSTISQENSPVPMKIGNSITAVSAGPSGWHTLMLRADGTVWACGDNDYGQLGNGSTLSSFTPVQVLGPGGVGYLSNIIAIAAGNFHSMALCADGTVYTWGRNSHGQLGLGDTTDRYTPVQAPGASGITAIAAGGYHSLALQALLNISMACGYNGYGQLGVGDTADRSSFTWVNATYTSLMVGGNFHSVFVDNFVLGPCGLDSNGQLGDGGNTDQSSPEYENGTIAIAVAAGGFHTLHLNGAGEVWESGYNGDGELGLGDNSDRSVWNINPNISQTAGIACCYDHSLFLSFNGALFACGYGAYGQLGNGSTSDQYVPTYVAGAPYATGMAGGWGHTVILTTPYLRMASEKVSPKSVVGGANATGTATLTGLAGAGGQTVYLYCPSSLVSLPASVKVASTSRTASFPIHTSRVSATTVVTITAYLPLANGDTSFVTANLTLNP